MFRIGILGASWIASKAIIEPAQHVENAHVQGIATRDKSKAAAYAEEHGIEDVFPDYKALIASSHIDVVYVGLPPSHHAFWSITALNAGKHVICEKPIAMNADEAKAMVDAAEASKGRLVEAFHTRYHPSFSACLEWVKSGAIGDVESIKAHFGVPLEDDGIRNQFRPEAGGGSVMDMGCYPLQWADAMSGGDVTGIEAKADLTASGVDGRMAATLSFDNGVTAQIACSMIGPGEFSAGMTINGSQGTIEFSDPLVPQNEGKLVLTRNDGEMKTHEVSSISTYQYQLKTILDCFESGITLKTEGMPIIRQQALIDRVYEAAGLGHLRSDQNKS